MANLYPPILTSQRESIASETLTDDFVISCTMPSGTEVDSIGHIQVLFQRQSNLDSWSSWDSVYVPQKTTIYLPASRLTIYDTAGFISVPAECIRGKSSTSLNDSGDHGFPAGTSSEGETFSIQVRFGEAEIDGDEGWLYNHSNFASWNAECVAAQSYGEWSNTQKMYVYSLGSYSSLSEMFTVTTNDDPVLGLRWDYSPKSQDSLYSVTIELKYTDPEYADTATDYGQNYLEIASPINASSGDTYGGYAELDFGIMRFTNFTVDITFLTINQTKYKYEGDISGYAFATKYTNITSSMAGSIEEIKVIADELEDGMIYMSGSWNWLADQVAGEETVEGRCDLYRVATSNLKCVLLESVSIGSSTSGTSANVLFKDYSVEMGEDYIYFITAYNSVGTCMGPVLWDNCLLSGVNWQPYSFSGYARNMNFEGCTFLTSKYNQLNLKGNVSVSSLKRNTSDQFTTTLGSAFPYYSRAGSQNYRTFSLQALIGIDFDPTNLFLSFNPTAEDAYTQTLLDAAYEVYKTSTAEATNQSQADYALLVYYGNVSSIYRGVNPGLDDTIPEDFLNGEKPSWTSGELRYKNGSTIDELIIKNADLFQSETVSYNVFRVAGVNGGARIEPYGTGINSGEMGYALSTYADRRSYVTEDIRKRDDRSTRIYAERKFRDKVMTFLSDGKPKLFRSETEGNMIVMTTGASFSPFMSNRQMYSVSMTVTEIAEYNLENLIKYDLAPCAFTSFCLPVGGDGFSPAELEEGLPTEDTTDDDDTSDDFDPYADLFAAFQAIYEDDVEWTGTEEEKEAVLTLAGEYAYVSGMTYEEFRAANGLL